MLKKRYKKLNMLCIVTIIVSIIIGFFNPYEYYTTFFCNLWYALAMFVYFVNVKVTKKASEKNIIGKGFNAYAYNQYKLWISKRMKIFMIVMLWVIKIVVAVSMLDTYLSKDNLEMNFFQNAFLLKHALIMFILATAAEIAVVISFSIRIWKENKQEDVTVLCR